MKTVIFILSLTVITAGISKTDECQVINRTDIQNCGITRISDLLRFVYCWHSATLDGFHWQTGVSGFSGSKSQSWILMVNGQRIDMNFVGEKSLNLLPLTIDAIDSVEIYSTPQLYQGEFIEQGLIHIYTSQSDDAIAMRLQYTDCNESGDPGPYRYTNLSSENVDQIGSDYSATASLPFSNFFLRGMVSTLRHPCTDIAISRRHTDLSWNLQRTQVSTISLQCMIKALQGQHWIYAAQGASGAPFLIKEFGAELFFFSPFGTEIPVANRYRHLGANGQIPICSHFQLNYQAMASASQTARPSEYRGPDFAWNMRTLHAAIELSDKKAGWHTGAAMDRFHLKTSAPLLNPYVTLCKFYANYKRYIYLNYSAQVGIMLTLYHRNAAIKSHCRMDLYKQERNDIQLNIAYTQRFFAEDNDWWYWKQNGYAVAGLQPSPQARVADRNMYKHVRCDVTWRTLPRTRLTMTANIHFYAIRDLEMDSYRYNIEPFYSSVSVSRCDEIRVSSSSLGGTIGIDFRMNDALMHQFHYELNKTADRFKVVFSPIPRHCWSYKLTYQPVHGVSFWAMVQWHSSIQWSEYSAIDQQSLGVYSSWIHNGYLIDVAVQKWLWHKRIRTHLLIRNLLNTAEKYHPLGASFNMRLYFQLELLLDRKKISACLYDSIGTRELLSCIQWVIQPGKRIVF